MNPLFPTSSSTFFKYPGPSIALHFLTNPILETPQNAGKSPKVFQERTGFFNERQRRGAMRRKIHEVSNL